VEPVKARGLTGRLLIVWRLRGKKLPTRRSMDYVIGKAKGARQPVLR